MPPPAPQQQQSNPSDNSMAPVWITILVFLVAYVIWSLGHQHIVAFIFQLNLLQIKFLNLFIQNPQLSSDANIMQTIDPATVTWGQLSGFMETIGYYMRYPVVVILLALAFILYRSNITLKFRRVHDMKTLRSQEQYNWPAIMPVIGLDLMNADISKGPWAMASTPMEFARKYHLLRKEDILLDKNLPGLEMTAGIRRGDAKRVFTLQLGPYWEGFNHCPPHVNALAAVFMARINRDRKSAKSILETLDYSYAQKKPNFSQVNSVLRKYINTDLVQEVLAKHAYILTMMASLLEVARNDGVVPSAEFLWLKPVDRRLWYMLNSVGRQTPFVEVGGPFAHWLAEKALGRRSLMPMIDEAINALEVAIKDVRLTPREMQELKP